MGSISSLSTMVSALMSNQSALNTTAHNLSNVNTPGYVRQQVLMRDARYITKGQNATTGFYVGLGADVQATRQIRDQFLDQSYRNEISRYGFYSSKNNALDEVQTILGEIEGESFAKTLDQLWVSLNELAKNPAGLETRGTFVESAVLFVNKANLIAEQLSSYQDNLNTEIIDMVNEINEIGLSIFKYNDLIVKAELSGGNANDYRDQRNALLDRLSKLADISYKEDDKGFVTVRLENVEFVTFGGCNQMGLAPAEPGSVLVKPVWTHLSDNINSVFKFENKEVSPENDNDKGELKGLLLARGTRRAYYTDLNMSPEDYNTYIKPSVIMEVQAQFDNLIHGIVTMINDILCPNKPDPSSPGQMILDTDNAPYGLESEQGFELFVRKNIPRYDASGHYIPEDPSNPYTLYSAGNLEINQAILEDYDKLALSKVPKEDSDTYIVTSMLKAWDNPSLTISPGLTQKLGMTSYYNEFVSQIGGLGNSVMNMTNNQHLMTNQIDKQRSSLTAVSSDEELGNMIKYQHAYNAAAKVVNILDEMIKQIVLNTGLVGR